MRRCPMKLARITLIFGLIASLLFVAGPTFGAGNGDAQNFAPDRVLVKFRAGTDLATRHTVHSRHGGLVLSEIPQLGIQVVRVPRGEVLQKAAAYKREKAIEFVEPDFIANAIEIPSDPYLANQWDLDKIQAQEAWNITTGNASVTIAILDTGVDQDHEDLRDKIVANKNFTTSSTVDDLYGHGTHVAGIAAASTNNGIGIAGVGYNCSIMNVKVLDDSGSGYYSWIANGIIWAADNGAKVINMSLGGSSSSSTLESAINYAWSKDVVIVAAAGNNGNTKPVYPAYYSNCIAVAATDESDAKASFSTYGTWVDVAAPGVNILSTLPNHKNRIGILNYGYLSGTSMATPHVAGLAGLVWATPYGTSNANVRSRIESTADPIAGSGTYWQYGRINGYKAVAPQDTGEPNKMHIQSITMALKKTGLYTYALATITVVDANDKPVAGATVSGHWSGATTDSDTGTTNGTGQVTVQSNGVRRARSGTTFTFTVDNVALTGWTYDSANNVETFDSITVP
jgi:thermitase